MSKIPKGLTDKDMMQNYVEEVSLEDKFIEAEKIADKKRRSRLESNHRLNWDRLVLRRSLPRNSAKLYCS